MEERKILKYDEGVEQEIRAFDLPDFRNPGPLVYQTPSLKNSPAAQGQKERRFAFDPLLKDILSTDEETEKLIQDRVESRVSELRDQTLEQAREEGYQAGFQQGESEARERFEEKAREIIEHLESFVAGVEATKDELYQSQQRYLHELMFRFAEVILERELILDKDYLNRKVKEIVEKVGAREMIRIVVHPSRMHDVYRVAPELEQKYSSLRSVSVEASEHLEVNDCVVETDFNRIDATLKSQLQTLRDLISTQAYQMAGAPADEPAKGTDSGSEGGPAGEGVIK